MPVFAIVLENSFLDMKAASKGEDSIFENKNVDKYEQFKCFVKDKIVKFVANTDQIKNTINGKLSDIIFDSDYDLSVWIKNDRKIRCIDGEKIKNNYSVSYIKMREEIDKMLDPLHNMFMDVKSLNIVTASGVNLLEGKADKIINLLERNVEIKIIALKAGTQAYKEHFTYKLNSLQILKDSSEKTWETWAILCDKYDKLFLKNTNICLPYNILYVEKNHKEDSFIKIDLYSINAIPRERPCLYIKSSDKMFNYFVEQFREIWECN